MANNKPTHRAYALEERKGRKANWTEIGAAFAHQDGKGFNIQLRALPVEDRIVLRAYEERKEKASDDDNGKAVEEKKGK